jgi:phage FluMu protein Com
MKANKAETTARQISVPASNEKQQTYKGEQRCICNRLICIIKGDVIEIKCPKCKRMMEIVTKGINYIECK